MLKKKKESIVVVAKWQRKYLEWKESEDFSWKHPHCPLKNIYSSTTCRCLKMSGRLSHFCRKINFAAKPEFMAEKKTTHNANGKSTRVLMILGARRSSTIATIHFPMLVIALNNGVPLKYIITERSLPFYKI